jgi:hypothetical protein
MSPYQQGRARRKILNREQKYIGIDVSKESMDVTIIDSDKKWRFNNNPAGIKRVLETIEEIGPVLVVFEAKADGWTLRPVLWDIR